MPLGLRLPALYTRPRRADKDQHAMTEIHVEEPDNEPDNEPVIVAPTIVTDTGGDNSDDLALAVGRIEGMLGGIIERVDRLEGTAETAIVVAETAAVIAAEAVEEAHEEPEPVVVIEEEPDESPVKEPWTHRSFLGSRE